MVLFFTWPWYCPFLQAPWYSSPSPYWKYLLICNKNIRMKSIPHYNLIINIKTTSWGPAYHLSHFSCRWYTGRCTCPHWATQICNDRENCQATKRLQNKKEKGGSKLQPALAVHQVHKNLSGIPGNMLLCPCTDCASFYFMKFTLKIIQDQMIPPSFDSYDQHCQDLIGMISIVIIWCLSSGWSGSPTLPRSSSAWYPHP